MFKTQKIYFHKHKKYKNKQDMIDMLRINAIIFGNIEKTENYYI